jgi:uncharacterized protein YyaL (SSP411 family)
MRSKRCKEAAIKAAKFLFDKMWNEEDGSLRRVHSTKPSQTGDERIAYIDDYAYLIGSCIALFDLTFDKTYLHRAEKLQDYLDKHFMDDDYGGYFQTRHSSASQNIVRLKPGTDNALPSPNGVIAMNLLYLSSYLNDTRGRYLKTARQTINSFAVEILQHPYILVTLLGAVVLEALGVKKIQVQGKISEVEMRSLNGWGRTLERLSSEGEKKVLLCENGVCREMVEGELDKMDYDEDGK